MRDIRLENVSKSYNGELILDNINLTIPGGKFFTLLGPSGSGKTTLLRLIGGFEKVDSGNIYVGDMDITNMPINERPVNTVFQNYALFPHLNVYENIAYSLTIHGVSKQEIEQKVKKVVAAVNLEKQMYKSITYLSGGQQQRVALARAVINEPEVLLLDEPLAALDLKLREKMLLELIDLQDTLKTTFVYVTHDQFEALTVADTMAIMNTEGEIEQIDTPKRVYEFPASSFVARFVGTTNIFYGVMRVYDDKPDVDVEGLGDLAVVVPHDKQWATEGTSLMMSLRPEKIAISKVHREDFSNHLTGIVESIVYHGRSTEYHVRVSPNYVVSVFEQNEEHFPHDIIDYDDEVHLYWQKENVVLLDR